MNARDFYADRPDLYDLMHTDQIEDTRFVQEVAGLLDDDATVLELGCGTGRLLVPLLDANARVVGLDRQPMMLNIARERLALYGDRVRLHEGDMRRFSLDERFDMALIGLNTFMHLLTLNDQLDCLHSIYRHLKPAGLLVLDLANPHAVLRDTPLGVLQHRFTRPAPMEPGTVVTLWSSTAITPAAQLTHTTLFFDETTAATGGMQRTVIEVVLRLIYRYELELLLARSGFGLRQLYGDYESSPYDDESERLICVASALA